MPRVTSRLFGVLLAAALLVAGCSDRQTASELVVGASNDADSVVLAELHAAALRYYGSAAHVERLPDPVAALDTGKADVVPGFTGHLLQRFAPGATATGDKNVYAAMVGALPEGVGAGDYTAAAQDAPAVAVTSATASAWGARDLSTLVRHCAQLTAGAAQGARPPSQLGSCKLPISREFPGDAALFDALRTGQINAAWTTTADPDIPGDVEVLADGTAGLVQAENVVPLYRRNALSQQQLLAINEIAGEFDTGALADMRRQVDAGRDPRQVAEAWLAAHPLGR
jgi:glycine betaine/choline ABC-type transport system substrate-binding protein